MQEQILDILMKQNDVTWQDIIYGLIKSEEMNPWDINISKLTGRYLETVKQLQDFNFNLSGKVLLAAALLVRIKSSKLVSEELPNFDNLLFPPEDDLDMEDDMDMEFVNKERARVPPLGIRSPLARKRRVTVQDLVSALEKALKVNKRRILRHKLFRLSSEELPSIPERKVDMKELVMKILEKIKSFFQRKEEVTFSKLLPSEKSSKEEKVFTLLPLLKLNSENKIELEQFEHFGEIYVKNPKI